MALYGTIDTQYVDFPAGVTREYLRGEVNVLGVDGAVECHLRLLPRRS